MHRFFLPAECFDNLIVRFPKETAHQLVHVLRLETGGVVVALDNQGREYDVVLDQLDNQGVNGHIIAKRPVSTEPAVQLALYLGLAQREKFEWMLQKCTEVGAASFTPLVTRRSLVQDLDEVKKKYERWERILREAAEQSRRGAIPELNPPLDFNNAILEAKKSSFITLIPWEGEHHQDLTQVLQRANLSTSGCLRIACFIGPEGGWDAAEVAFARDSGAVAVTLGPRILRMETAAVVAAALILHELE